MFTYNKQIDKECWRRLFDIKKAHGVMFPKTYTVTKQDIKEAKNVVIHLNYLLSDKMEDIKKGMYKIFKVEVPDLKYYVTTAHYSMDKYPDYIAISKDRKNLLTSILHELNHFMLQKTFPDILHTEETKEIIEVVNIDVFGIKDTGWPMYKEQRSKTLAIWKETFDIEKVIKRCFV